MTGHATTDWAAERGDKWRAKVQWTDPMLKPVDEPLIEALALSEPLAIADIGCGSGETSIEIASQAPDGSAVHGYDVSPSLIELAKENAHSFRLDIGFSVADAAAHQPQKGGYDRLASRFGVMFFEDPQGAFENLTTWLKPGGRFAFAVWGPPVDNLWIYSVRDVVAEFVEIPKVDPDAPGPFRYAEVERFIALLSNAGFSAVASTPWKGTVPIGDQNTPAEAAEIALSTFSTFDELLGEAAEGSRAKAVELLASRFSEYCENGQVRLPAHVSIVTGGRV